MIPDIYGVPSRLLFATCTSTLGMLDFSTHVLLTAFLFVALSSLLRTLSSLCRCLSLVFLTYGMVCQHDANIPVTAGPQSVQSTPVISRLLGAKIRERELSGSPVISRCRAKATTREFRITDPHTPRRLQLANSMLSDNRGTYVSRISTHIDIAPATNHNKQH